MARAIPFRDAIIRSAGNKCQLCEATEELEVHHLKHEASGLDDLIVACKKHHSILHQIERTLRLGWADGCLCGHCRPKETPTITWYQANKRLYIHTCPECGATSYTLRDTGEVVDILPSGNPFTPRIREYLAGVGVSLKQPDVAARPYRGPLAEEMEEIRAATERSLAELVATGRLYL